MYYKGDNQFPRTIPPAIHKAINQYPLSASLILRINPETYCAMMGYLECINAPNSMNGYHIEIEYSEEVLVDYFMLFPTNMMFEDKKYVVKQQPIDKSYVPPNQ